MAEEVKTWSVRIYTSWKRYKKLIPAIIGMLLLFLLKRFEIEVPGLSDWVLELIISGAAAVGIAQVRNEPKPDAIVIDTEITKEK